jgi:urea transport system ATP-binding protein
MTQPILQIQDVSVRFDGFTVLDSLSFSVDEGELRFLIGPNGAGKTTMLDVITGKTRPDSGRVLFEGHDLRHMREHTLARRGIGRKFQTPTVFPSLTVYQNIEVMLGTRERLPALVRPLRGVARDRLIHTLEQVGLNEQANRLAGTLAHGEKQWLEIGMLLAQEPRLLLLDEPVAGMTRRERDRTGELVTAISKERSTLLVEHDMEFVRQFASKVTVLHAGQVLCEGPLAQVQSDQRVIEVYLGRGRLHMQPAAEARG